MKHPCSSASLLVLMALCCLALAGCQRHGAMPTPLPLAQIPGALNKGFANVRDDIRTLAERVGSAVTTNDLPTAYMLVQSLCAAPGLDQNQRLLATRSMLALTASLRDAEAQGDQRAAAVLLGYQRSK